jgi:hypothetical protein
MRVRMDVGMHEHSTPRSYHTTGMVDAPGTVDYGITGALPLEQRDSLSVDGCVHRGTRRPVTPSPFSSTRYGVVKQSTGAYYVLTESLPLRLLTTKLLILWCRRVGLNY